MDSHFSSMKNLPDRATPRVFDFQHHVHDLVEFFELILVFVVHVLGIFGLQHSVMARPAFKDWWAKIIPPPVERSTFVIFTNTGNGSEVILLAMNSVRFVAHYVGLPMIFIGVGSLAREAGES